MINAGAAHPTASLNFDLLAYMLSNSQRYQFSPFSDLIFSTMLFYDSF
jgi:hypothetical protein